MSWTSGSRGLSELTIILIELLLPTLLKGIMFWLFDKSPPLRVPLLLLTFLDFERLFGALGACTAPANLLGLACVLTSGDTLLFVAMPSDAFFFG